MKGLVQVTGLTTMAGWGVAGVVAASAGAWSFVATAGSPLTSATLVPLGAVGASVVILATMTYRAGKWDQKVADLQRRVESLEKERRQK